MYTFSFTRNQIGMGAASAMMMLMIVAAVVVPFMYSELRSSRRG
jgi:glucose/mannose transport system permease protein